MHVRADRRGGSVRNGTFAGDAPGKATLQAGRSDYSATVDVLYDGTGFQVRYRGCVRMEHAVDNGHVLIQPRYNKWVSDLSNEIRRTMPVLR